MHIGVSLSLVHGLPLVSAESSLSALQWNGCDIQSLSVYLLTHFDLTEARLWSCSCSSVLQSPCSAGLGVGVLKVPLLDQPWGSMLWGRWLIHFESEDRPFRYHGSKYHYISLVWMTQLATDRRENKLSWAVEICLIIIFLWRKVYKFFRRALITFLKQYIHTIKNVVGYMAHTVNSSTWEAGAGRSPGSRPVWSMFKTQTN